METFIKVVLWIVGICAVGGILYLALMGLAFMTCVGGVFDALSKSFRR